MSEDIRFPTNLKLWKYRIEQAARRHGLEMFPIIYVVVNDQEMAELAARGGFPTREHHWRFGQESLGLKKQFRYGMSVIYEMVINTGISYAYLLQRNLEIDQKSVMAHVCGHVDFFRNNAYYAITNRDMLNAMASDALLINGHCETFGRERVQQFLDRVLSFEHCVDPNLPYRRPTAPPTSVEDRIRELEASMVPKRIEPRESLSGYMDQFLNPPEWIAAERERLVEEALKEIDIDKGVQNPSEPTRDILHFLSRNAPLEHWQRDIVDIIRRHGYYFMPQWRTKVMNEGWASLWQEEILNEAGMMTSAEVAIHCKHLAGVQRKGGGLNPYRLGVDLWRDIKKRWDTARHGDIFEKCPYASIGEQWELFAIFKILYDEAGGDASNIEASWREFSCFMTALTSGNLCIPAELFVRDLRTTEELVPAWHLYHNLDREYERQCAVRDAMEPLELQASLLTGSLLSESTSMPPEELALKARRDVYEEAGRSDLWLRTLQEVRAEITALESMLAFRADWRVRYAHVPAIPVPTDWYEWASRNPEPLELMRGTEKMFEVRASYDDASFLQEFFTKAFCEEQRYFLYKARKHWDGKSHYFLDSRSFRRIKRRLLWRYVNANQPIIRIVDGNWGGDGSLYLLHEHQGVDLDWWSKDQMYIKDVLQNLFHLWGGRNTVYLETVLTNTPEDTEWWWLWHTNDKTDTDELEMLAGKRFLFHYGLKRTEDEQLVLLDADGDEISSKGLGLHREEHFEEEFDMVDLGEEVTFPAPF